MVVRQQVIEEANAPTGWPRDPRARESRVPSVKNGHQCDGPQHRRPHLKVYGGYSAEGHPHVSQLHRGEIQYQSISPRSFSASRMSCRKARRSCMTDRVKRPCLRAFWLPMGAPEPLAPPCMRHRFLPRTAGDRHGLPVRVLAPHRGLESIGPVLRLWVPAMGSVLRSLSSCLARSRARPR